MAKLGDFLTAINLSKKNLMEEDPSKKRGKNYNLIKQIEKILDENRTPNTVTDITIISVVFNMIGEII